MSTVVSQRRRNTLLLQELEENNAGFLDAAQQGREISISTRGFESGKVGQKPEIAILACADSRVPPEIIFKKGIGDLFVVRSAGNIADAYALASLEYAIVVLGVKTLIVQGHEGCGAVKAALDAFHPENLPGSPHLKSLIEAIQTGLKKDLDLPQAVSSNVSHSLQTLIDRSSIISSHWREKKLDLVSSVYDIKTGQVSFL